MRLAWAVLMAPQGGSFVMMDCHLVQSAADGGQQCIHRIEPALHASSTSTWSSHVNTLWTEPQNVHMTYHHRLAPAGTPTAEPRPAVTAA